MESMTFAQRILCIIISTAIAVVTELFCRSERLQRIKQKLETKKELASTAVKFAEQALQTLSGVSKSFFCALHIVTKHTAPVDIRRIGGRAHIMRSVITLYSGPRKIVQHKKPLSGTGAIYTPKGLILTL